MALRSTNLPATLTTVIATAALTTRASRSPDRHADRMALTAMLEQFVQAPESLLQSLVTIALRVTGAHSAGISLLRENQSHASEFYWPAIAGAWTPYIGGTTPRDFSPCGIVLDQNGPQLFAHPERYYEYLLPAQPPLVEVLLAPFHVGGQGVGTVWIVSHTEDRRFDAEDARRLESLAKCAAGAFQILTSFDRGITLQVVCAGIQRALARVNAMIETPPNGFDRVLSGRERTVVHLLAQGYTNKAIAEALGVSAKTIETYRARASDKLGCRNRADFVRYARGQGWSDEGL